VAWWVIAGLMAALAVAVIAYAGSRSLARGRSAESLQAR
jgi:hypothetical protein